MTNNDVLRRLRFIFDFGDDQMIEIFGLGDLEVDRAQVSDWLKRDEDPAFQEIEDKALAHFLNGFITFRRGPKEGEKPMAEDRLNNNIILRKLKIALALKNEDMLEIFHNIGFDISPHEITALFRREGHPKYRECKDQFLRNFFQGMDRRYSTQS